jgi:hypothetical protein
MKKLTLLAAAFSLFAADPWQSKPFTEWSDKDVQKILSGSPWARSVTIGGGPGDNVPTPERSGNRPAGMNSAGDTGAMGPSTIGPEGSRDRSRDAIPSGIDTGSIVLTVLWQSAMPVKQALVRRRFGVEGAVSVDAKKMLDENAVYLISVSGLTPAMARAPQAKSEILTRTTLLVKGKEPLHATDILVSPSGKVTEAIFVFPKTVPFALEDKDVEFSTQLGAVVVRSKFHLKDMVVAGALQI